MLLGLPELSLDSAPLQTSPQRSARAILETRAELVDAKQTPEVSPIAMAGPLLLMSLEFLFCPLSTERGSPECCLPQTPLLVPSAPPMYVSSALCSSRENFLISNTTIPPCNRQRSLQIVIRKHSYPLQEESIPHFPKGV